MFEDVAMIRWGMSPADKQRVRWNKKIFRERSKSWKEDKAIFGIGQSQSHK